MYTCFKVVYSPLLLMVITFTLQGQIPIDYTSIVTVEGSTSQFPTHYAYGTLGPFTAFNRVWVFYCDGDYAVWKTKTIEGTGQWDDGGYVFNITQARYFNVAFDGEYFHFIRAVDGDLRYLRGKANKDGSIQFDPEIIAYSDPVWKLYHLDIENYPPPRHFAITVDSEKNPWIITKVSDGSKSNSNFKPIAISLIAPDGVWITRPGFPVKLADHYPAPQNGRSVSVIEIAEEKILFTWGNFRSALSNPEREFQARLWSGGNLGPIEHTGLTWHTAATSLVVPESDIALLNSQTQVARRNPDGSWTNVSPGGLIDWEYNSLSAHGNKVRLWSFSSNYLRYKETTDNGTTWSQVFIKWPVNDMLRFSASHDAGSQGNHHSLLWSTGTDPFNVVMGIEGDYEMMLLLDVPSLVSPADLSTEVPTEVVLIWNESEGADSYHIQVALDVDFTDIIEDIDNHADTLFSTLLDYEKTYYWRVNASNDLGTTDWSKMWSFKTVTASPETPILVSPVNTAIDISVDTVLVWQESSKAETYHVQLSDVSDFTRMMIDTAGLVATELEVTELDYDTKYYWRVRAMNVGGVSDWSEIWYFTSEHPAPGPPTLVGPDNGSTDITNPTLLWNSVSTSTHYRIQIAESEEFVSSVVDKDDITNTYYKAANLEKWTRYYWRVRGINKTGQGDWSETWSFETGDIVSVDLVDNQIPTEFSLGQNYPNPFNPLTSIQFALPKEASVRLEIFNMLGQRVSTIVDGEYYTAGIYEAVWDVRDDSGSEVSSGVYIYRIVAGDFVATKKMILMR